MNDRQFINNLIKAYFSDAKEPHQASLNNAVANRLNDIANKLEKQKKELEILKPYLRLFDGYLEVKVPSLESDEVWYIVKDITDKEERKLLKRWLGDGNHECK